MIHRFVIEVDVPDDHDDADDAEWWADAAAGACSEYGADLATFTLLPLERTIAKCAITVRDARSDVDVTYDDGSTELLFSYYRDELTFREAELVGLTAEQARRLHYDKDVAYLRS